MERKPWVCKDCGIAMQMHVNGDFCKCPLCKTEVWFVFCDDDKREIQKTFTTDTTVSLSMVPGAVKKGSSKSGKSNRKRLLKKKTTGQIFKELKK